MKSLFTFLFALSLLTAGCNSAPKVAPKAVVKAEREADHSVALSTCSFLGVLGIALVLRERSTENATTTPAAPAPVAHTAPVYREAQESIRPTPVVIQVPSVPVISATVPPSPAPIARPQFKPTHAPKHFIIDGANVCRSYDRGGFRLETLLTLVACILEGGNTFECYFDASTRYAAERYGSLEIQNHYLSLLQRYPVLFRETPAGEPADDTILLRADRANCTVISNDLFKRPEDQHAMRFPWVSNRDRIFRGRQYHNQLQVNRLDILRAIPATLEGALKKFNGALGHFAANVGIFATTRCEMQMAA